MIGEAVRALSKLAPDAFVALTGLDFTAIHALAKYLAGGDEPVEALAQLPETLRSEIALAAAEARAKTGGS